MIGRFYDIIHMDTSSGSPNGIGFKNIPRLIMG